jgi:hypothetical protein
MSIVYLQEKEAVFNHGWTGCDFNRAEEMEPTHVDCYEVRGETMDGSIHQHQHRRLFG